MSQHATTCKFCKSPLVIHLDDDCPPINAALWIPLAACNRCADFHMRLVKIGDGIKKVMEGVFVTRGSKNEAQARSAAVEKLEEITQRMMRIICDHYRVQYYWQHDLVDEIMAHPDKVRFLVSFMRAEVEKHARKGRAEARQMEAKV